jgi:2-polyprenyl-6-methoxyphenol hydroxylase-like FAD-dependent oxidoreductase
VEEEEGDEKGRKILASVVDEFIGVEHKIRTRYLFGADGGRSSVAKILDLPFTTLSGGGFCIQCPPPRRSDALNDT